MVYFASGGSSSGAITFSSAGFFSSAAFIASAAFIDSAAFIASAGLFSSAGFIASAGLFSSAGFIASAGLFASAGFIASAGFSASAGFNSSAGFFATTGPSGIITHAKPCPSHKKKLAKRHTETRPAKKNTIWPLLLAAEYSPIRKKAKVAIVKPTAKRSRRRDKTFMRLLI